MSDTTIKGFRGKDGPILLDYSGVANVPGAIQSIAELTAQPGDHIEVETVGSTGRVATVKAVAKPGGNSGQNPSQGLTDAQVLTLRNIVNAIGVFDAPNGQELVDAFNAAWGVTSGVVQVGNTLSITGGVTVTQTGDTIAIA